MAFALHRAAPAIFASAATVAVGMLCLSFADLNSTAGLGPVLAIGVAVTMLVMVTLLPALLVICGRWVFWPKRPAFRSAEPTADGFWARVGRAISHRPRRVWLDDHRPPAARLPRPLPARRVRAVDRGHLHEGVRLHQGPGAAHRPRPGRQLQHHPGRHQRRPGRRGRARRWRASTGSARPGEVQPISDGRVVVRGDVNADISSTTAADIVEASREAVARGRRVPTRSSGGGAAFYLDTKIASERDSRVIMPLVLGVVLLILIGLLRALRRAADPDRDGGAVVRRRAGHLGAALRVRLRLRRVRPRVPAVRVRVPRGAGHRLQHLPDDPGAGGDGHLRHPQGLADRPGLHRRRDHLGRHRPRRHLPGARLAAAGVPRRARRGRGARRHARHARSSGRSWSPRSTSTWAARSGGRASSTQPTSRSPRARRRPRSRRCTSRVRRRSRGSGPPRRPR